MLRISLSIGAVLASLLFPSGRAIAARAIYAYLSPCEALGVGCPEGSAAPTPAQLTPPVTDSAGGGGGAGSGPVYVPPPVDPLPVSQPQTQPAPVYDILPVPAPYVPYAPYVPVYSVPELPPAPLHSAASLHPAGVPAAVSIGLLSLASLSATVLPAFRRKYV